MYLFSVAQDRAQHFRDSDEPFVGYTTWLVLLGINICFAAWVFLWVARIYCSAPGANTGRRGRSNVYGLPRFKRGNCTAFMVIVIFLAMGGGAIPILFKSSTYPD